MNKKFLLLLTIFIFSTAISVQAQERLTGLQRDVKIQKEALLLKENGVKDEVLSKNEYRGISLPGDD